ncbi:MAG TPA: DUF4097 family beta strand repeat-containing protein, partial [Vicinamibacterales bacterium]|nr:DUF4097 family beta strand repeat-containing protein [Vicinamibacterales bacterium]
SGTFADIVRRAMSAAPALFFCAVFSSALLHMDAPAGAAEAPAQSARVARTLRIARGTPISIRATVGDITVTGWDRPDVEIDIVRSAPSSDAASTISATIDADDTGLHITAVQPDQQKDARLRGSITVHAPVDQPIGSLELFEGTVALLHLHGGVRATVDHGSIKAIALGGAVRLETGIGDVQLENAQLADQGMIRLRAFNGNVTLSFAATPAHARILALSLDGAIRSDIPLNLKTAFGPRFGEATIGGGGPVVSIDVVSGNIRINRGAI